MDELFFCHQSGEPLIGDTKWFRCLQCRQHFKMEFRFEDKPICRDCAFRTGTAALLKQSSADSLKNDGEAKREEQPARKQTKLQQSMEAEGFRDNGNGTVTQLGANLVWMRFCLGQHWQDGKCVGEAERMTYAEAEEQIRILNKRNFLGHSTWMIPAKQDLLTLVKRSKTPTINSEIFPKTPGGDHWTSTGTEDNHMLIDFYDGQEQDYFDETDLPYVRLAAKQQDTTPSFLFGWLKNRKK